MRDPEKAGSSGDRSGTTNEIFSEQSKMTGKKKGAQRKVDGSWDDSEDVRARVRGKRSRDDDRREWLRAEATPQEDSDDGSKVHSKRRGEDSRAYRSQTKIETSDDAGEIDDCARPTSRVRIERTDDDRIDRNRARDRAESGQEELDDSIRLGSRGELGMGDKDGFEKPFGGCERNVDVVQDAGKFNAKGRSGSEGERVDKQRDSVGGERTEAGRPIIDNALRGKSRGNEERREKSKSRDGGDASRDEFIDGGNLDRRRSGKQAKESRISDGRKGYSGDWCDNEFDVNENFGQERESSRNEKEKDRHRYMERERTRDKDSHGAWERDRRRDYEEVEDRLVDRIKDRYREGSEKCRDRELSQDFPMRDRGERDKSGRDRQHRTFNDRDQLDVERGEDFTSAKGSIVFKDGSNGIPSLSNADSGRGVRVGVSSGGFQEFAGRNGDLDWDGPVLEDRLRNADSSYSENRERHTMEDEPPPGLEQGLGPSPGAGVSDSNTGFNLHGGRGRAKSSTSSRSRGTLVVHDARPNFGNNQGTGLMVRGMQPGGKGGRGGRGLGKVGRGGGRDGQRVNLGVIAPMGPGMPGPIFGQLGPPGPIGGLGPGIMGPGGFPMPPFGGRMGWNAGGDLGLLSGPPGPVPGPPRFVPGMGPGPPGLGPNVFFNSPGPVRGGPGSMSMGAMFGASSPFGGRPMPGERNLPNVRTVARGSGPAGRGPSRGEQNDYSQHFVDTGLRPQNFIRDVDLADRFEEYPKLKELIARKDKLIAERATPPMYMQCDLRTTELRPEVFGTKFDVILVDPPWEEYVRRAPGVGDSMEWWSHSDIQSLRIEAISDTPAFIFLWVGDAEGLDQGRVCLKKWGFRRCEDICWVKTNRENPTPALRHDANTVLQHSKEHCLMGIKGTVRRSTDGHIIHANVDTDIIISEEPDYGSTTKPEELYHIIEHFAQGQRRIELFGEDHNIRAGWVTVGKGLSSSNFSPQTYAKYFSDGEGKVWQGGRGNPPLDAPHLVGTTSEIESLRPKSPPPRTQQQSQSHVAHSIQVSGTNVLGKRTTLVQQTGVQNGSLVSSLVTGVGAALLQPDGGVMGGGNRAGPTHVQISKEIAFSNDAKSFGVQIVSGSDRAAEERRFTADAADNVIEGETSVKLESPKVGTS